MNSVLKEFCKYVAIVKSFTAQSIYHIFSRILTCKIVDRKKDLVKLQYGEYVSLGKVESELKTCSLVDNVCVYADPSKMFAVALIMPNPSYLKEMAVKGN